MNGSQRMRDTKVLRLQLVFREADAEVRPSLKIILKNVWYEVKDEVPGVSFDKNGQKKWRLMMRKN